MGFSLKGALKKVEDKIEDTFKKKHKSGIQPTSETSQGGQSNQEKAIEQQDYKTAEAYANSKGINKEYTFGNKVEDALGIGKYDFNADPYWQNSGKVLTERLNNRSIGVTPSAAETALQAAQRQNLGNALVGINAIGGISPALKQRMAQNQAVKIGSETSEKGAMLRLQEQQENDKLLAAHLAQMEQNQLTGEGIKSGAFKNQQDARSNMVTGLGSALAYYGANK